jgi:hypothetical protein
LGKHRGAHREGELFQHAKDGMRQSRYQGTGRIPRLHR